MGLITDKIMSCFTTPAIMEMLGHYRWRVYEPFRFYLSEDKNDYSRNCQSVLLPISHCSAYFLKCCYLRMENMPKRKAVIHDYLYHYSLRDRKVDLIFLDGWQYSGVPKWKRTLMYLAVRMFG